MQGKQTCPSCRSNLMVNKDSDVESADSDSSSDSDESSASSDSSVSSVSSVASSSSSSSSSSSFSALRRIAGTSPSTSSDEEDDEDVDFLSEYRVRITIPEGLIDAENKHTKNFHEVVDSIMETRVMDYADHLKEALTEQAMKYKEQVKERYVLYAKLNKHIRMNCPVFVPRSTSSAIRKNVDKNKIIMDRFHHAYRRQLNEFTKVDKKWLKVSKEFLDIIMRLQIQLHNLYNTQVPTLSITRQLPTMDA